MSTTICTFPVSPTYLPFHRYLYYTSLLLSVLYPTPPPLVAGAFAFSLTYASTAAIYAILILAIPSQEQPLNLDIFGVWAILSVSAIAVLPLLTHTKSVRASARPILRIWGVLIAVATICTYILLIRSKSNFSAKETLEFCEEGSHSRLRLRNPKHVEVVEKEAIFGHWYNVLVDRVAPLIVVPSAFGLLTCFFTISQPKTSSETYANPYPNPYAPQDPYELPSITIATPGRFSLFSSAKSGFLILRKVVLYLTPAILVPTMVLNELYLMKHRVEAEEMYEVGQWGIFVGAGLIAFAAFISHIAGKTKARSDEFGLQVGEGGLSYGVGEVVK